MPLARSFLYVPANREKFLEKAIGLPSDAFIFDLEVFGAGGRESQCSRRRARLRA